MGFSPLRTTLLASAILLLAAATATHAGSCGWNDYDFSSLMGSDIQGGDGGEVYQYYLNVCGSITSQSQCTQVESTASACQVQVNPKGASFDTGNWVADPTWSFIEPNNPGYGVMYQMTGAQSCWATGSPTDYYAAVQFVCAPSAGAMVVQVPASGAAAPCTQNYTIPTPLACQGGGPDGPSGEPKKGGMSGGWVFIIILCVAIPLYVAIGCLYKSQKLGATGMDKCPNVEFWRDLPALVKEGCMFTVSKIRGLCGGGVAKDAGSYETM